MDLRWVAKLNMMVDLGMMLELYMAAELDVDSQLSLTVDFGMTVELRMTMELSVTVELGVDVELGMDEPEYGVGKQALCVAFYRMSQCETVLGDHRSRGYFASHSESLGEISCFNCVFGKVFISRAMCILLTQGLSF